MAYGSNFIALPQQRQRGFAQTPTVTPQQQQMLSSLLSQGFSGMENLQPGDFSPIRKMYESQFQQETVPQLAEQFAGMGSGNMRSSAFQQSLGSAGAGLSEKLAGMQQQFRQGEIGNLMNMLQLGMQPQFQSTYAPKPKSEFQELVGELGQIAGPGLKLAASLSGV